MQNRKKLNQAVHPMSPGAASVASAAIANSMTYLFFHPLSTAVSRVQMHDGSINSLDKLKRIIFLSAHDEGLVGKVQSMFKGSISSLNYKFLSRTIKYAGQPVIAGVFGDVFGQAARNMFGMIHGNSLVHAAAGGVIGALDVALLHPLSTFKTKRQAFDLRPIAEIYKAEQFSSFYNGYGLAFAKAIPASFVLFGTNAGVMSYYNIKNPEDANLKHNLVAAACGVILGALVTNPQDVVMKRAQLLNTPVSSWGLFKETVSHCGLRGLYRGIGLNVAASLPKKAVPFALYGFFLRYLSQHSAADMAVEDNLDIKSSGRLQ